MIISFEVYNNPLLSSCSKVKYEDIVDKINGINFSIPGRMELVKKRKEQYIYIDYAHTPDAYENVLSTINNFRKNTEKLIIVFGCGGDRDSEKRSKMTAIACNMSNQVIITADNPRTEKIENIISDFGG